MSGFWPRPDVLDRIPTHGDVVIEASAGTGKTYTLEHLVIDLVLNAGLRLEQILVVTFTEKAASELSFRLRTAMTKIHQGPWTAPSGWRVDDEAQRRLTRALTSFDNASISTIHAFCKRMLTEHAFVNGRLFQEELVDGRAVFQEAFLTAVRRGLATDPTRQTYLTAWLQRDTLEALSDRLYEAHTRGGTVTPPFDAAALARHLDTLSRMPLTPAVLKPTLQRAGFHSTTIRAFLNRIKAIRTVIEHFVAESDPALALLEFDTEDEARRQEGGLVRFLMHKLAPVVDSVPRLAELYRALSTLESVRVPLASAVVQVVLPVVQETLRSEKRASGRFDFDDMLTLIDEALQGPAQAQLIATLRRRFRVALIDEFQDTDRVQWSIFQRVFADSPEHRLVVIGDPKQAIYGFRGADVQTYLEARRHLAGHHTPVVHLTDTYRATAPLASALNRLLDQRRPTPFFTGEIRYDHPVRAAGQPPSLRVDGAPVSPIHAFALAAKKDTMAPSAATRTLNERIAREIAALLDSATLVDQEEERPLLAGDVFVLTRTGKEGLAVARALRVAGIPYAFYKQDGLFQTAEALDVRHLLNAIAEPHDRARRLRAWIGPFFSVPMDEARQCLALAGSHPLMSTLFRLRALADDKRWAKLFAAILSDTGIIERELLLSDSERELTNYQHIFEILLSEALKSRGTLTDLLHAVDDFVERRRVPAGEDGNVMRLDSDRAAVQIMTMHKAKGLEAPVVFLAGGLDRNPGFAHVYHEGTARRLYLGDDPPDDAIVERNEEDQRLGYVALTRAQSRLYLPYYGGRGRPVLQRLSGSYGPIDRALEPMLAEPTGDGITVEPLVEMPYQRANGRRNGPPGGTTPPSEAGASNGADRTTAFAYTGPKEPANVAPLRSHHRGALITSYSRLKEAQGGFRPLAEEAPGGEDRSSAAETPPEHLPGGTASGRFIHEMLELVDLGTVVRQAGWPFWAALDEVAALFERGRRRYDRRPEHLPHSYELVFAALRTPMTLGPVSLPDGIAGAERVIREMEFLYAMAPADRRAGHNRGYVKGFIDVVIEHDGQVIVLDWKTDLLPTYDPKTLNGHVAANYALQADLYTLAIVRLLGIDDADSYAQRFAGTAYVFIRGLDAAGAGVYFTRPSWDDIRSAYERLTVADVQEPRS